MMVLVVVELRVARPRRGHSTRRDVGAVFDETEELVFVHSLAKLAQHVIVYVSCLATRFKKGASVIVPSNDVVSRKQIGTHRQEDCECVGVGVHFRLVGQPVKNAKGNLQRLLAVLFVLRKSTGLERDRSKQ